MSFKKNIASTLAVVFLSLILISLVVMYTREMKINPKSPDKDISSNNVIVDYALENVIIEGFEEGIRTWKLSAENYDIEYRSPRQVFKGISQGEFTFNKDSQYKFRADMGTLDEITRLVRLTGNVIVDDDKGMRLETDYLDLDMNTGTISTEGTNKLSVFESNLKSKYIEFDMKNSKLIAKEGIMSNDSMNIQLNADMINFDLIKYVLRTQGDYVLTMNDALLKSKELNYDISTSTIMAKDNVTISKKDDYDLKTEELIYDVVTGKFEALGKTQIEIYIDF